MLPAMMPSLDSAVFALPMIVSNLMGFGAGYDHMTKEMKDVRDMPKAVFPFYRYHRFLIHLRYGRH